MNEAVGCRQNVRRLPITNRIEPDRQVRDVFNPLDRDFTKGGDYIADDATSNASQPGPPGWLPLAGFLLSLGFLLESFKLDPIKARELPADYA
jgi:hypothetical protein